ncbi:MAG: thiamine-phosphate kinase [Burkholderiaceae bacterium]
MSNNGEFDLIDRHFRRRRMPDADQVVLGIGDDCALLRPQAGCHLAVSTDMLVEGRHFLAGTDPARLGHKALAVNLSDLAAMGARPLGFTLALALPSLDDAWLAAFSTGMLALADRHRCPLVGGDTTRGPLTISITVLGEVRTGQALRRDAARPGDDIYLSGRTGEARLALDTLQGDGASSSVATADLPTLVDRLETPWPRVALGQALAGLAHAAIDLSDGLVGDLGHVLKASACGARLHAGLLPVAPALSGLTEARRMTCLLAGGDDYELLFTAAPDRRDAIQAAARACDTPVTRIGEITRAPGLMVIDASGQPLPGDYGGYDHFR